MSKSARDVGKRLVELCNEGRNRQAIDELYSPKIVSIEAQDGGPEMPPSRQEGIDAIRGKNDWWNANHEIHSGECTGPLPNGDKFIAHFKYDVTATDGPMKGQRMQIEEDALYTVMDGKITQEEFFYDMGQ